MINGLENDLFQFSEFLPQNINIQGNGAQNFHGHHIPVGQSEFLLQRIHLKRGEDFEFIHFL